MVVLVVVLPTDSCEGQLPPLPLLPHTSDKGAQPPDVTLSVTAAGMAATNASAHPGEETV